MYDARCFEMPLLLSNFGSSIPPSIPPHSPPPFEALQFEVLHSMVCQILGLTDVQMYVFIPQAL